MGLQTRSQWEEKERQMLAPYATLSSSSMGRYHPEPPHDFRSEYQRDRDRITHCTAFRRLEYKTQVVLNSAGDNFRTRLTHTMEVASIARTAARALGLNEDLTEAIALGHDLGHAPFGHPGEHTLNQLMSDHGGFEHNMQSLRVVEELEMKYPEFNGLNLTMEVREGIHFTPSGDKKQPSLETQVVSAADEIAYCCHDLADALDHQLIDHNLLEDVEMWVELNRDIKKNYSRLDPERHRFYLTRCIIEHLMEDLCEQSAANLEDASPGSSAETQTASRRLVGFSMKTRSRVQNMRDCLVQNFYYHPKISRVNQRSCWVIQALYEFFYKHPHLISEKPATRMKKDTLPRVVCDYIAGMTDREALQLYSRHIGTDDLLRDMMPMK